MGVPKRDLGHGHYISRLHNQAGDLVGFVDEHPDVRDPTRTCSGSVSLEGSSWATPGRSWRMTAGDPETLDGLTLEPSLLCTVCGDHGFVRAGRWVPA
jgi:hypothetical protein